MKKTLLYGALALSLIAVVILAVGWLGPKSSSTFTVAGTIVIDRYPLGCMGWEDTNGEGITVKLRRVDWSPCGGQGGGLCGNYTTVAETTADGTGTFVFEDVPEGEYIIAFPSWAMVNAGGTWFNTSLLEKGSTIILRTFLISFPQILPDYSYPYNDGLG